MNVLAFFEWCEASQIGAAIRGSGWFFPAVESVHLLGLAALGGAVIILDLRLLGLGLRQRPVAEVATDSYPWLLAALVVMIATGVPLFLSEAVKCYYSQAFWVKITVLPLAVLFAFTVRRRVALMDESRIAPIWRGLVGLMSLALWFTVGAAGRWIGFS